MHIYTKRGDSGQTSLADGKNLTKDDLVFETIGTIDELNSWIGYCNSLAMKQYNNKTMFYVKIQNTIYKIQYTLFSINSILANSKNIHFDAEKETKFLECEIDAMEKVLPALYNFILPGGSELSAMLHVARTVCRRGERRLVSLFCMDTAIQNKKLIPYLNRLSDFLFTLSRWVNFQTRKEEILWEK